MSQTHCTQAISDIMGWQPYTDKNMMVEGTIFDGKPEPLEISVG